MLETTASTTLFGQWLRQRRRSLDLTQTELARRIGYSVVTIRKIEAGERRPSRQMAHLLADIAGIVPEDRAKFIQFARRDANPDSFRHPLFSPLEVEPSENGLAPEEMFAADFPGWIKVTHRAPVGQPAETLLVLHVQSAPVDSPRSECMPDGRLLCKIFSKGQIAGHLEGVITQEYSHLVNHPDRRDSPAYLTAIFNIDTAAGSFKGYYAGFSATARNGKDDQVRMRGQVLSVTPTYIDLFMAEVFYEGGLYYSGAPADNASLERGTLMILPR